MREREIRNGDLLFLDGDSWLAGQIQDAQKDAGVKNWKLNHVGKFLA